MKKIILAISFALGLSSYGQFIIPSDHIDSLKMYESNPVPIYSKEYMNQYNRYKRIIVKVYPYALYASDVLYELEEDVEDINKDRKKKKVYKEAYHGLKDDFKYVILDLYTSEGNMLMKLVHRETGLSVYEIAEKYRGKKSASIFNVMGKIWDQDVKTTFDPLGKDKIAEHVIQDIEAGIIPFDSKVITVDKDQYKENQKAYKKRTKENKKRSKENAKNCKQNNRDKFKVNKPQ